MGCVMSRPQLKSSVAIYYIKDDGIFPNNNTLPVLFYKAILTLPKIFPARGVKNLFAAHGWTNSWKNSIYDYHHYHSITHEVLGVYKGKTKVQIGGENGIELTLEVGDVIVIPAGVAHKNLTPKNKFKCVGAYPDGKDYDINTGKKEERPKTDENIKKLPVPLKDPVFGLKGELQKNWK
jgi:uncharacterized protein YjlB